MSGDELRVECPTCGKAVCRGEGEETPYFPFCSRRCKMVDLDGWFEERHRIAEDRGAGEERQAGGK